MAKPRKLLSGSQKARLAAEVRKGRRDTVYRMLSKKHDGVVPCFVCGRHVPIQYATLEHIVPISLGGSDDMNNLAISHDKCNNKRGATIGDTLEGELN